MSLIESQPDPSEPSRLVLESGRTCDRLRTMPLARLTAALPDGGSRARHALELAQRFADRAAGLAGRPRRTLPALPPAAAGDVLAVCSQDLVEELQGVPSGLGAEACRAAVGELIVLRKAL